MQIISITLDFTITYHGQTVSEVISISTDGFSLLILAESWNNSSVKPSAEQNKLNPSSAGYLLCMLHVNSHKGVVSYQVISYETGHADCHLDRQIGPEIDCESREKL